MLGKSCWARTLGTVAGLVVLGGVVVSSTVAQAGDRPSGSAPAGTLSGLFGTGAQRTVKPLPQTWKCYTSFTEEGYTDLQLSFIGVEPTSEIEFMAGVAWGLGAHSRRRPPMG